MQLHLQDNFLIYIINEYVFVEKFTVNFMIANIIFTSFFSFLGKLPNWGMDTVFLHQIILYALLWSRHTKIFLLVPIVTEMRKVKCFSAILAVSQLVILVWHKFIISINQRQQFWRFLHLFSQNQKVYIFMAKINKLCVIPPSKKSTMTMKTYST